VISNVDQKYLANAEKLRSKILDRVDIHTNVTGCGLYFKTTPPSLVLGWVTTRKFKQRDVTFNRDIIADIK